MQRAASGEIEENGTSTSSTPRDEFPTEDTLAEDMFVRHKVSKLDTLAGLAIRYHVAVSDIKRANGLLSDSAMFARDTLLIPRKPLSVGAEYSTWAGMIVMQYGKLRAKERCPAKVQYNKLTARKTSIDELRGYYSTSPASSASDEEDEQRPFRGTLWQSSREVELMTRTGSSASTYADERLRRRTRGDGDSGPESGTSPPPQSVAGMLSGMLQRPLATWSAHKQQLLGGLHDLRRPPGRRKDSLLDRLKKVASQPALAVSAAPVSMVAAADAVINSALPPGLERSSASASRQQALQQAAYNLVARPKESKAD